MLFHANRLLLEKYRPSRANEDVESMTNSYDPHNGLTTTYLDISGRRDTDSSVSGRFKRYMHTSRYLKFGWTRRAPERKKNKYFEGRKAKTVMSDLRRHHASSDDDHCMRNRLKKKRSNPQSPSLFTIPLSKNSKTNGKSQTLPHIHPQTAKVATKVRATMKRTQSYAPVASFTDNVDTATHDRSEQQSSKSSNTGHCVSKL